MRSESRVDAKLKNLTAEQQLVLWRFRHPDDGSEKLSYADILVEIPLRFGITSSLGALSEFYSWYSFNLDMEEGFARAEQAKMEILAKNPDATPEHLQSAGQIVFTSRAMQSGDIDGFVKLMAVWEKRQQRIMDQEKWEDAKLTAKRKRETEDAIRNINQDNTLSVEEQRSAVLSKMDEFFGLSK